jgi:hypothetical protein
MLGDCVSEIDEKKWEYHPRVRIQKDSSGEKLSSESGRVTSEMLERRNFRMNKPFIPSAIYFNNEANDDTIRHYVDGIGDTNHLFRDADYARKTRYGGIIAPGTFLFTHQWTATGS